MSEVGRDREVISELKRKVSSGQGELPVRWIRLNFWIAFFPAKITWVAYSLRMPGMKWVAVGGCWTHDDQETENCFTISAGFCMPD